MRPIFDAHLDLSYNAVQWNRDLTVTLDELNAAESGMKDHPSRGRAAVSFPEMRRARVDLCVGTVLARAKSNVCPTEGFSRHDLDHRTQSMAYAVAQGQLAYYRQAERDGHLRFIRTRQELATHWQVRQNDPQSTPLGLILAMEGCDPMVTLDQATDWWDDGLRCASLAHFGQGHYAMGTGGDGPLTERGRQLLKEFESLGMILDLTHTADTAFWDALDRFSGPVHASHNMCRAIVPRDRQFSDEQIRALISRGAVVGMAFVAWMISPTRPDTLFSPTWKTGQTPDESASLEKVVDHVDHICQLAGNASHVGLGTDLDGGFGTDETPHDLKTIADLHKLNPILARRGYSSEEIDGILYGNWLRFFSEALPNG